MWTPGRWTTSRQEALARTFASFALPLLLLPANLAAADRFDKPIVYCQLSVDLAPKAPQSGGMLPADYGSGSRLILLHPDGSTIDLAPDFASACDPDVSFDGSRILFAGKRQAAEPWNIWEIHVDGSQLRQITHETLNARHPVYLATFYTITSSEPWYTILFVRDDGVLNETASAPGTSLHTVRLDGSERRRITFHPGNDRTPYLMQDGLLLFAGMRAGGRMGLFGIQTDGIDYAAYGASSGKRLQHMPSLTTDGTVIFVEADSLPWDGAGQLASVKTRRPHHSYQSLTAIADGRFHSPSPLDDGTILVSRRLEGDVLRIVRFSPSEGVLDTIHGDSSYHALHARLVAPRPEPDGRSSTVRPESPTGKLFCLDVYESDPAFAALEPGSAKRLRVIEGVALKDLRQSSDSAPPPADGNSIRRRMLGEAPIEQDGSFHIDIPADLPVQLQLLDSAGLALASCDWIWVKQREFRGCIGCHEDPELTPPNRFVEAARRPATELTQPPESRRSVTFRQQIAPVLRAKCQSCHQKEGKAGESGLVLNDPVEARAAFAALVQPDGRFVTAGAARTSPLIWRLFGRDTSRPWDKGASDGRETVEASIPTDHIEILSPEERRAFVEWVDLGAQWDSNQGAER